LSNSPFSQASIAPLLRNFQVRQNSSPLRRVIKKNVFTLQLAGVGRIRSSRSAIEPFNAVFRRFRTVYNTA
jgi:hypothetical protein